MKILHVVTSFPPAYAFGGAPYAAYLLARELARRGHEVTIYTTDAKDSRMRLWSTKEPWIEKEIDGMKVVYFRNLTMLTVKMFKLFVTPALPDYVQKEVKEFDIVHLHEFRSLQNIIVAQAARKYGIPYLLQAHGSIPRIGSWKMLKLLYDITYGYKLLEGASRVITLTSVEAEQCKRIGVPETKIVILPNGIDLPEYSNLPVKGMFKKRFNISEDKKIILYLGRIHWIKGLDVLIKAFALLKAKDVLLVIAGPDDGFLSKIKALVKFLHLENSVLFIGPLYGKEKLEALVDAEFLVLPSRYETFPTVVLEAYACAKPVIASKVQAMHEIVINEETGYLFQSENVEELANKIMYLLEHPEEIRKKGMNAQKLLKERFTIKKVVNTLENIYKNIIGYA
jgi:glycosyltransferase involved in cell wall biosynthesis